MVSKRLRSLGLVVCIAGLLLPIVYGSSHKAEKIYKDGLAAEAHKEYDHAVDLFEQALALSPKDPAYLLADRRARSEAALAHIAVGKKLREQQQLDQALVEFQKAFAIDPSVLSVTQEIAATMTMIKERSMSAPGAQILTPTQEARRQMDQRIHSLQGLPILQPISPQITTLKINNQSAKVLYETVGKLAGINVLFDSAGTPELSGKTFNLDLQNASLEEALNYISILTNTFWKPVTHNAIFVASDT